MISVGYLFEKVSVGCFSFSRARFFHLCFVSRQANKNRKKQKHIKGLHQLQNWVGNCAVCFNCAVATLKPQLDLVPFSVISHFLIGKLRSKTQNIPDWTWLGWWVLVGGLCVSNKAPAESAVIGEAAYFKCNTLTLYTRAFTPLTYFKVLYILETNKKFSV